MWVQMQHCWAVLSLKSLTQLHIVADVVATVTQPHYFCYMLHWWHSCIWFATVKYVPNNVATQELLWVFTRCLTQLHLVATVTQPHYIGNMLQRWHSYTAFVTVMYESDIMLQHMSFLCICAQSLTQLHLVMRCNNNPTTLHWQHVAKVAQLYCVCNCDVCTR